MVLETRVLLWLPVTGMELSIHVFNHLHQGAGHSHSDAVFRGFLSPRRTRPVPSLAPVTSVSRSQTTGQTHGYSVPSFTLNLHRLGQGFVADTPFSWDCWGWEWVI